MTTTLGDALERMSTNERLARRTLALLRTPVMTPPADTDDLGVWLAANLERAGALSDGELVLLNTALAIYNGDAEATVADLRRLDRHNRAALAGIISDWLAA